MANISRRSNAVATPYRPLTLFDVWDSLAREMWDSWRPFKFESTLIPRADIYEERSQYCPGRDSRQDC